MSMDPPPKISEDRVDDVENRPERRATTHGGAKNSWRVLKEKNPDYHNLYEKAFENNLTFT